MTDFIDFERPWLLLLLLLMVPAARRLLAPGGVILPGAGSGIWRPARFGWLREKIPDLVLLGGVLLVGLAAAGPRLASAGVLVRHEGIDIVIALDVSASMGVADMQSARIGGGGPARLEGPVLRSRPRSGGGDLVLRTRLDAVKEVVRHFVASRRSDRIGLVLFGSRPFTHVPLTTDREVFSEFLDQVETGSLGDETALGDGLAMALLRLRGTGARSKVVVLLTDGRNNSGRVDPDTAAGIARSHGIRIYTVGVGRAGSQGSLAIDEETLRRVAERTGGRFYRAGDGGALTAVYRDISGLEVSRLAGERLVRRRPVHAPVLLCGLALFGLAFGLRSFLLPVVP